MTINFKEIPEAHKGGGLQDTWELFCREFFVSQNYEIIDEPARGADGGLDIKVKHKGKEIIWLVSCKHKAHSGVSVSIKDEINIRDRVESKKCDGFIGFYSTLPSSGLKNTIVGLSHIMPFEIFDREKIERAIVGFYSQERLFMRFFPDSFKSFKDIYSYREPVKLFLNYMKSEYQHFVDTYKLLFTSIENIIPYLRNGMSFEEAIKEQNITILPIKDIEKAIHWKYQFKHSDIIRDYSFNSLQHELLPMEAKHLFGIEIFSKSYFIGTDDLFMGLFAIYPNYIICSPQFITVNNKVFKELSEALT